MCTHYQACLKPLLCLDISGYLSGQRPREMIICCFEKQTTKQNKTDLPAAISVLRNSEHTTALENFFFLLIHKDGILI